MSDETVLADGLSEFYEVFKYLEDAVNNLNDCCIAEFRFSNALQLTERFETDLKHYFGNDWKEKYKRKECVDKYLAHLSHLEATSPESLVVYLYHLYLGVLSGGQLFRSRLMNNSLFRRNNYRLAVFEFDKQLVQRMKNEIKEKMNELASRVDDEIRKKWITESNVVFTLNIELIKNIESCQNVLIRRGIKLYVIIFIIALFSFFVYHKKYSFGFL